MSRHRANFSARRRTFAGSLGILCLLVGCSFDGGLTLPEVAGDTGVSGADGGGGDVFDPPDVVITPGGQRVTDGLLALYDFSQGIGTTVSNRADSDAPDLVMEGGEWLNGRPGVALTMAGRITSGESDSALGLTDAIGTDVTIEVWFRAATLEQAGPARIVSLSESTTGRTIQLGQDAGALALRLNDDRTHDFYSDETAIKPWQLHHVICTHRTSARRCWLDGEMILDDNRSVALEVDSSHSLNLANEGSTKSRAWLGELYLVAFYERALSGDEVQVNYQAKFAGAAPDHHVSFGTTSADVNLSEGRSTQLVVTRAGDVGDSLAVPITLTGALEADDVTMTGAAVFEAGATSAPLLVLASDDAFAEGPEVGTLVLKSGAGYQVVDGWGHVTIDDTAGRIPDPLVWLSPRFGPTPTGGQLVAWPNRGTLGPATAAQTSGPHTLWADGDFLTWVFPRTGLVLPEITLGQSFEVFLVGVDPPGGQYTLLRLARSSPSAVLSIVSSRTEFSLRYSEFGGSEATLCSVQVTDLGAARLINVRVSPHEVVCSAGASNSTGAGLDVADTYDDNTFADGIRDQALGRVGDVLIFDKLLSDVEHDAVDAILRQQHGLR